MRKIGIVSEYFYPHLGGITEHVAHFSRQLLRRGFEVVLLTGYEGEDIDAEVPNGLRVIRFGRSHSIFANHSFAKVTLGWNLGKKIKKVLDEERFDLLHIQSPTTPILPLMFEKYTDTVTVGTAHTYFDSMIYYKLFEKMMQRYFDKLDGLIAVSPSCVEALRRHFRCDFTIIPNGVEVEWFSRPAHKIEKYNDGSQNILFLGRLDPRNGLSVLLSAFRKVLESLKTARLIVVGDGPMRPLYEKEAGNLLGKKIFFDGHINRNRPEYFATADVFCYPANKASFGITLLEAMAAGIPVVASDNRGFRDMIQHGQNGLLAGQEDAGDLAKNILRVLNDSVLAENLVKRGRETAEHFRWTRVTDQILGFYNQVYLKKRGELFHAL